MNYRTRPRGMAPRLLIVAVGFTCVATSFSQGTFEALTTPPYGNPPMPPLFGIAGGVGWSFVPTSDLLVTAVSSTAPQVSFWLGSNHVIATYSHVALAYQAVEPLLLSAGQTFFISTQNSTNLINSHILYDIYALQETGMFQAFTISSYISQFASYQLTPTGQWTPFTASPPENVFLPRGPNFQFQVVPEPSCFALLLVACGVAWFRSISARTQARRKQPQMAHSRRGSAEIRQPRGDACS